jgi:plastocyanin
MGKSKRLIFTAMAIALVGIVAGLLPGCASTPTPTSTQAANEVIILGRAMIPDPITVTAGTTVTWTNMDSEDHIVASVTNVGGELDGVFNVPLGPLAGPPESFSYIFDEPGTFSYRCYFHEDMFGYKVIVE